MDFKKQFGFTSASSLLPIKILLDTQNICDIKNKEIKPVHLQFMPTNKCNLKCSWYSCADRNKKSELDIKEIKKIIEMFAGLGTKSVTISGGGEPCLHPNINEIIYCFYDCGIEIGLVTNGYLINNIKKEQLRKLVWCRISCGNHYDNIENYLKAIRVACFNAPSVDWAFSYVMSSHSDFNNLDLIVNMANAIDFTHVRIVPDLYNVDRTNVEYSQMFLKRAGIDDSLVIYQDRDNYTCGRKKCLISLIKPVITAEGRIQPCCAVQYLKFLDKRSFGEETDMGSWSDFVDIFKEQRYFNGEKCDKCYYDNYNYLLDSLQSDVKHINFI